MFREGRIKEGKEKKEPGAGVRIWLASNLCGCPDVKEELIGLLRGRKLNATF